MVLEAEHAPWTAGVTVFHNEGFIGYFDGGDKIGFSSLDLTNVYQIKVRFASGNNSGGAVEIRAGNGHVLATLNVYNTGGYNSFHEVSLNTNPISGWHDLHIVGKYGEGIFNLDKITLVRSGSSNNNGGSNNSGGSVSGVASCNDSNSVTASNGANVTAGVGKCLKYRHTGGQMRIGVFSGNASIKYDVRNCNGAVTNDVSQQIGAHVAVRTGTGNCDHYIYVKEAPSRFDVQFGSW